jgi:hypothetical protein
MEYPMRKLLLALALLLTPSLAIAQCNGVFPVGTYCGNNSGVPAVPSPVPAPGSLSVPQYDFIIGNASNVGTATALTGDCTYGASGIICTKTNGVAFGSLATLNAVPAGSLPAGVDTNVLRTATTTDAILTSDCGKTVQEGAGSTGYFTVTLPAVSGFATTCKVTVTNGDTVRAKKLSGFPTNVRATLYPLQTVVVEIINGAWVSNQPAPSRWAIPASVTIYVDNTNGNDTNDGLASGSGNAFQTLAHAIAIAQTFDINEQAVVVQLATSETYTTSNLVVSNAFVGATYITIQGDCTSSATWPNTILSVTASTVGIIVQDYATLVFQCLEFSGGSGAIALESQKHGIIDFQSVVFAAFSGGSHLFTNKLGVINATGNYTISGGAAQHIISNFGEVDLTGVTVTLTGTPAFSAAFIIAQNNGYVVATNTFSGSATGTRYTAAEGGQIQANGNCASLPGNSSGSPTAGTSAATGGSCN